MSCLFCKMVAGEIPCEKVYEDNHVLGFKDIYPQAHQHYLFIHKSHSENINDLVDKDGSSLISVFKAISEFSLSNDLAKNGFRVVTNQGQNAGQTVFHTHFHLLGGGPLGSFGK